MRFSWRNQYSFLSALYFSALNRGLIAGMILAALYHYSQHLNLPLWVFGMSICLPWVGEAVVSSLTSVTEDFNAIRYLLIRAVKYLNWVTGTTFIALFAGPMFIGDIFIRSCLLLASQFVRGIWSGLQSHIESLYIAEGCAMHDKQQASDEVNCFEGLGATVGSLITFIWAYDILQISVIYSISVSLLVVILLSHSKLPTETPIFAKLKLGSEIVSPSQLKNISIWTLREVHKRDMRTQYLKDDDEFDPPQHCGLFTSMCCSLIFAASEGAILTIIPIMIISLA